MENKNVSVLVVDDSTAVRSSLVSILLRQNFTVFEATSGKQAMEILDSEPAIQLVITDYHMPDMDGYELTKRIRGRVNAEELRIIGVSSSSDRFLSVSFLKAGASDFIFRPFVAEELQCRIEQNIETLKSIHRFKHLAERDPLTGLYNRRVFFERLHGGSLPIPTYVAILDIDNFKSVNDNFGHDIGDRVIQAVASQLSIFAEKYDMVVARLGGEEFGMLVSDEPSNGVGPMFEELRTSIELIEVETASASVRTTASIGISKIYRNEPVENFLNAADQLLYLAKNTGRNRVCCDQSFE